MPRLHQETVSQAHLRLCVQSGPTVPDQQNFQKKADAIQLEEDQISLFTYMYGDFTATYNVWSRLRLLLLFIANNDIREKHSQGEDSNLDASELVDGQMLQGHE